MNSMMQMDIVFAKPYRVRNTVIMVKGRYKTYPGQMKSEDHICVELYGMTTATNSHCFRIVMDDTPIIYSSSEDNISTVDSSDFGMWLKGAIVSDYAFQELTRRKDA